MSFQGNTANASATWYAYIYSNWLSALFQGGATLYRQYHRAFSHYFYCCCCFEFLNTFFYYHCTNFTDRCVIFPTFNHGGNKVISVAILGSLADTSTKQNWVWGAGQAFQWIQPASTCQSMGDPASDQLFHFLGETVGTCLISPTHKIHWLNVSKDKKKRKKDELKT